MRRCHGDLHLRNVCLVDDRPTLFDAVEFSEAFACIDVFYDLAFLLMDLWHRGLKTEANRVLNRYLWWRDDLDGLGPLPLFLYGARAERWRKWDSCFTLDFSYIHGGSVRTSAAARYRQWLSHKLATWIDQFGSSGCVGCGRCITWCPVGIDITEEVAAIRASEAASDAERVHGQR